MRDGAAGLVDYVQANLREQVEQLAVLLGGEVPRLHRWRLVAEEPELGHAPRESACRRLVVGVADPKEDQHSGADRRDRDAVDANGRADHPLQERPHLRSRRERASELGDRSAASPPSRPRPG